MKPKIIKYGFANFNGYKVAFLAVIKNGLIIDIACSEKDAGMFSEKYNLLKEDFLNSKTFARRNIIEIQSKDLALYTHWPRHTKEFWDLLNET